jgi:hypothetical protein
MPETITVTNPNSYGKGSTIHPKVTFTVEAILDVVPGAWAQPEDLANWIAQHSYVNSVSYEKQPGTGLQFIHYETEAMSQVRQLLIASGFSDDNATTFRECLIALQHKGFSLNGPVEMPDV